MKINPISFNKAQRTRVLWQELHWLFPDSRCRSGGWGLRAAGRAGAQLHIPDFAAGTSTLDKHPCHAERSDLENAIMYF